jgi:hypothetical protein
LCGGEFVLVDDVGVTSNFVQDFFGQPSLALVPEQKSVSYDFSLPYCSTKLTCMQCRE